VLLSTVRPNLKAFTLLRNPAPNAVASTGFAVLRARHGKIIPAYLLQMIRSDHCISQMVGMMGKGAYPSINQKNVESITFPLPPIEIQREIVAEIESYQRVIDGARQVVESYTVRISTNPDWPMVSLGDVSSTSSGGTPSKQNPDFWKGDIPWVSPKDMKMDFISDAEDHISKAAVEDSATKIVPAGTVLCVVRSGILQHSFPVGLTLVPVAFNQDIIALSVDKGRLHPKYLFYVLKSFSADILAKGIKPGVTVQSFHRGFFSNYQIPLPDMQTQLELIAELEAEQTLINANTQLISRFEAKIKAAIDRVWMG
jgi:type I restriction enzyme M protein